MRHQIVVLGAGRNIQGGGPSALVSTDEHHRVLDWVLEAFSVLGKSELYFVGGFRIREVEDQYPHIRFLYNPDWAASGPLGSLSLMPRGEGGATYVCYSDVVFRADMVRRLEEGSQDVVLAVDTTWSVRYDRRSRADLEGAEKVRLDGARVLELGKQVPTSEAHAEFAGLLRFSAPTAERVRQALQGGSVQPRDGLPELVRWLLADGASVGAVDVVGDWAELNAPQDLARFVLGTKAESLERLRPLVRMGTIGEQVSFPYSIWQRDPEEQLSRIERQFGGAELIVRSSALSEDNWSESSAGAYKSIPGVRSERAAVRSAIDEVFDSYDDRAPANQVLIQEMLHDVTLSGVIMTRTPTLGAPYHVINFDATTGSTESVTSGEGREIRTVYLHRGAELRDDVPAELGRLMHAVREIESLVGHTSLDTEFAFAGDGVPRIFQVRPIAVRHRDQPIDDEKIALGIERAKAYFRELQKDSPLLVGSGTQLSVMADWNPAEMIGTKPRRLAFSLYRQLITDESWAQQRAEYGYRDVRPCNLIVDFLGHPYIDVRVDFNSFVPAALPDDLADRLVDHYMTRLARFPELHDKVEFDVLFTCLPFDFDAQAGRLRDAGFDDSEIDALRSSLREITRRGIARCADDVEEIETLRDRCAAILGADLPPLERAYLLLEDVRRLGIPLFSHLARHAFVAVILLRSLRAAAVLDDDQVEGMLATMKTVPTVMQEDALAVARGTLSWEEFVGSYGHLRPGSYDITSKCYAQAPDQFLRPVVDHSDESPSDPPNHPWDAATRQAVDLALKDAGLAIDCEGFERYLAQAIEGREFGKFHFMRNVNAGLEAIAEFGAAHGTSRDDLSHVRLNDLFSLRGATAENLHELLLGFVLRGREESYVTQALSLPAHIRSERDFDCFEQCKAEPNFITRRMVRGEIVCLAGAFLAEEDLAGKIVLIPSADPGYDWLFSHGIAGLLTMYGGVNSHMAVRAAEFELPAAIGVGEALFERIAGAKMIELNCASRQIQVLG